MYDFVYRNIYGEVIRRSVSSPEHNHSNRQEQAYSCLCQCVLANKQTNKQTNNVHIHKWYLFLSVYYIYCD